MDVFVPGCSPAPEARAAAVMEIEERINNGKPAKRP